MCVCRCISGLITLATIAIIGVVVWRLLGRPESVDEAISAGSDLLGQAADVLQDFDWSEFDFDSMFSDESHFSGGDNETLVWDFGANSRNGLILTLKNNLDETWQEEYNTAVANWMDSNPAIVRLETEVVQDYLTDKCKAEEGLMMVCNGNHGDNGMLGFNDQVFDQKGVIYSSVATMNEFYLKNAGWEERLYTMCHEMGHGLGLPHTDENPYNADTFNCMDYTDNPENNILPGDVNFAKLRDIYGEVSRRRLGRTSSLDRDRDRDVSVHHLGGMYQRTCISRTVGLLRISRTRLAKNTRHQRAAVVVSLPVLWRPRPDGGGSTRMNAAELMSEILLMVLVFRCPSSTLENRIPVRRHGVEPGGDRKWWGGVVAAIMLLLLCCCSTAAALSCSL